jgi:hypothetical protein
MLQGKRRVHFSASNAGTIPHLRLTFPATFHPAPQARFRRIIQILDQVCTQYQNQIPAFSWKPIYVTSRELKTILGTKPGHSMTQRGNVSVIHAEMYGKRYTLQISPDHSSISLAVTGSREFYDLLIDINQDGNLLLSCKALRRHGGRKKTVELQLATMPSDHNDSYLYSLSYERVINRTGADYALLKAMRLQLQELSLTPELNVDVNDEHVKKFTGAEFESKFGVQLLQGLSMSDSISDIKKIHNAYRRLQPYIDGRLEYDDCIKNGSLQDVSQKSLLSAILEQAKKNQFLPKVNIVRVSDLVGYGLIAAEHIPAGTIIGEYCGEITKVIGAPDNTYFAAYAPDSVPGSELLVVNAIMGGNSTRFINHSDENANATWAHAFDGKRFRPVVAAVKPIPKGRQILLKYKDSYWFSKRSGKGFSNLSDSPYPF